MARDISLIDADISKVTAAINSYSSFYSVLADVYDSDVIKAQEKADGLYNGFLDNYLGNRESVYSLMDKIPTSIDEIVTKTTELLDNIGNYIQVLRAKLNDLNQEKANASSRA